MIKKRNHTPCVAIQQHFLSHYRFPIFSLLSRQQSPNPEYTFFSDIISKEQIKTIDFEKSSLNPQNGGLRWYKIKNFWLGKIFLFQPDMLRIALGKKYDCIICPGCMYHISTWVSAILARLTGKRVLMWTHGYLKEEKNFKGWIREKFYSLADGLLLYGNRSRELLIARGFNPDNLWVVYNSLDFDNQIKIFEKTTPEFLQSVRKEIFSSPDLPSLIFTGRLTSQKKISLLLEAVHLLRRGGMDVNLLLVGDGSERDTLESLAREYQIQDLVVFYGATYREEELGPLIMQADLCVSPGEIGLTCIHALTYGTPVITHDNPESQMPEWEAIKPGFNGDFFRLGDPQDLFRVIKQWLDKNIDREKTAMNCQEVVSKFYNAHYQVNIINDAVLNDKNFTTTEIEV